MTRILSATTLLLFATSTWAAEAEVTEAPAPEQPMETHASTTPESRPTAPVAEIVVAEPAPPLVAPPSEPEPDTGWGRGERAPMYVNVMLFAGALGEDGDNRLTLRDSKLLEGGGGLFRVGAVLGRHHRLGARLQSFVRSTKKVALDPGSTPSTEDTWGVVTFGYFGPEYLYTTDLGIYGGVSLGVGAAMTARDVEDDNARDRDDPEKASAGLASMVSLGYEWRASKWFALNVEAFGGLYHGVDDDENGMNGGVFGLGMGAGF